MKQNRTTLFIVISSYASLIVLIIQVNPIHTTAKIKEEILNDKANPVLSVKLQKHLVQIQRRAGIWKMASVKMKLTKRILLFNSSMQYYNFH
ncbi:MAG: hypothetical protein IPP27_15665 [Bacteroidetes bacterium]|nr:hypothetical protein [Bacteroidota bacterium]